MVKATKFKRLTLCVTSAVICFLLAFGFLNGISAARAADDSDPFTDYPNTAVSVSNSQFSDKGSGSPASPSNWTADGNAGNSVSGIISLDASDYGANRDDYKLDIYPEYSGSTYPTTPFGGSKYPNTNQNVLLINTNRDATVYGYTSSTFTLEANRYYSVSVYVKTGDFAEGTGASIRVGGVDTGKGEENELVFRNIDTVDKVGKDTVLSESNDYGFVRYTFYIGTSFVSSTASVNLSVGAKNSDEDKEINYFDPANGYAFFANLEVFELSPMTFRSLTEKVASDTVMVKDLNAGLTYLTGQPLALDDFSKIENTEDSELSTGNAFAFVYNANTYEPTDSYNFTTDPVSPNGKSGNSNIFGLSTYNTRDDAYDSATIGFRTKATYTVRRNSYVRFSVWAKTQDLSGSAYIKLNTDDEVLNGSDDGKLTANSATVSSSEGAAARYGWTEYALYVKGSSLRDYEVYIELWLGTDASTTAQGIAMFSEIRAEEITYTQYTDNNANGTAVTFDPTVADTGVTNGRFYEVGDYDEYKYPLAPSGWTYYTPDTVTTTGFSTEKLDNSDDVISGIIPYDIASVPEENKNYPIAYNPAYYTASGNLLMIHYGGNDGTAAGYASSSLTLTANTQYIIKANLMTYGISGYGANLVLKNSDNTVISSIERISADEFTDYTFYVQGGSVDSTVTLEIWLGLNDRTDNKQKLASGTVFVNSVSMSSVDSSSEDDVAAFESAYNSYFAALKNGSASKLGYAAYTFASETFDAYDVYDTGAVKTAYNWKLTAGDDVTFGIIKTSNRESTSLIPGYFELGDTENLSSGILFIRNNSATYSRVELTNKYSLAENTYHKLTLRLKVDFENFNSSDTAIGAGIELTGTDYLFEDVKSTALVKDATTDTEYYREFTFYIHAEAAAEVGVAFTLGGNEFTNQNARGIIYVTNIDIQEIGNTDYEQSVTAIEDYKDKNDADDPYNIAAEIKASDSGSDTETDTDTDTDTDTTQPSGTSWWLIPSILFAVAIVIAIVGFSIRKFAEKRAKRKTTHKTANYDRRVTLNRQQTAQKTSGGSRVVTDTKDVFETFDDNAPTPAESAKTADTQPKDLFETFDDNVSSSDTAGSQTPSADATADAAEKAAAATSDAPAEKKEETAASDAEPKNSAKPDAEKAAATGKAPVVKPDAYTDEFDD